MKPEDTLLYSHNTSIWLYAEPSQSNPQPSFPIENLFLILLFHLYLGLPNDLFASCSPPKPPIPPPFPLGSTCPFHIILLHLTVGYYLLNSRDHTVPYYAVSCITLLPSSYQTQLSWSQPTIIRPQTMFLPRRASIGFNPMHNDKHNYISVYFNTYDWPNGSFSNEIISCVSIKIP